MRYPDGRPDHIEDYLVTVRTDKWKTDMVDPIKNKYPKPE